LSPSKRLAVARSATSGNWWAKSTYVAHYSAHKRPFASATTDSIFDKPSAFVNLLMGQNTSRVLKDPSETGSTDEDGTVEWKEASGFEEEAEDAGQDRPGRASI
jgi:hypothetical protein